MRKNKLAFLSLLLLSSAILGCSGLEKLSKIIDENGKPQVVESSDRSVRLTVPSSWGKQSNLNESAILQVAQPFRELYVIVIPDPKSGFEKTINVDDVAQLVLKNTAAFLSNSQATEIDRVKVDGYDARRFEISGTAEKVEIKYVFTIVDTPETYYQIMAWSLKSMFPRNKESLLTVTDSFRIGRSKEKKN